MLEDPLGSKLLLVVFEIMQNSSAQILLLIFGRYIWPSFMPSVGLIGIQNNFMLKLLFSLFIHLICKNLLTPISHQSFLVAIHCMTYQKSLCVIVCFFPYSWIWTAHNSTHSLLLRSKKVSPQGGNNSNSASALNRAIFVNLYFLLLLWLLFVKRKAIFHYCSGNLRLLSAHTHTHEIIVMAHDDRRPTIGYSNEQCVISHDF